MVDLQHAHQAYILRAHRQIRGVAWVDADGLSYVDTVFHFVRVC